MLWKLESFKITYNQNGELGSTLSASRLHDIYSEALEEAVELCKIGRHSMCLTVLVIRRKELIQIHDFVVEDINHTWHLMDPVWESEALLWARPAIFLNDMLKAFVRREGFRLA